MLKIRRPLGRLIFNMGIAIPGKTVFLIETAPCTKLICQYMTADTIKSCICYGKLWRYCDVIFVCTWREHTHFIAINHWFAPTKCLAAWINILSFLLWGISHFGALTKRSFVTRFQYRHFDQKRKTSPRLSCLYNGNVHTWKHEFTLRETQVFYTYLADSVFQSSLFYMNTCSRSNCLCMFHRFCTGCWHIRWYLK